MKPSWNKTTNPDNLQVVQELRDENTKLKATIENNRINYNSLQRKLATALNGRDVSILTTKREKDLIQAVKQAKNRTKRRDIRIKNLENSIHDLRRNYQ